MCIFNREGEIEFANPVYSRMLGVAHDELLQTPIEELWERHYRGEALASLTEAALEKGTLESDLRCVTSRDQELWLSVRLQTVETGDGVTYLLLLQDDISERKEYEKSLQQALDEKGDSPPGSTPPSEEQPPGDRRRHPVHLSPRGG